jgi:DNA-binding MarR family transcriptional regulator
MPSSPRELIALTAAIRQCNLLLRTLGDELHTDLGLNVPLRGLLEFTAEKRSVTYKQIIEARLALPGSVDAMAQALVKLDMARLPGPLLTGQSPVIRLTDKGVETIKEIHRRELALSEEMARDFQSETTRQTTIDIKRLTTMLSDMIKEFRGGKG